MVAVPFGLVLQLAPFLRHVRYPRCVKEVRGAVTWFRDDFDLFGGLPFSVAWSTEGVALW